MYKKILRKFIYASLRCLIFHKIRVAMCQEMSDIYRNTHPGGSTCPRGPCPTIPVQSIEHMKLLGHLAIKHIGPILQYK